MSFLDDAVTAYFERERTVYPQRSNWPSQLGLDCSRQLVWNRTRWAEKKLPEPRLMRIFRLGHVLEPAIVRLLEDAGITIEQTQRPLSDEELELSGKIDGIVRDPGGRRWVPDFKTTSGYGFKTIVKAGTAEGLLHSEKAYLRGYTLQVAFYAEMLGLHDTGGLLFFANKESLETFTIEVRLDDPAVVSAMDVKRAQLLSVNEAVRAKVDLPPEPGDHCGECPFLTLCAPDMAFGEGLRIFEDGELAAKIARHEELKDSHHEYERLDGLLRDSFQEPGETVVGDWLVVAKPSSRTVYEIPDDVKAPYATKVAGVRRSYVPIVASDTEAALAAVAPKEPAPVGWGHGETEPAPKASRGRRKAAPALEAVPTLPASVAPTVAPPAPAAPGGFDL